MSQIQIFKLNCISCNGSLEILPDTNKFTCGYCGVQQIVERKGGIIQLEEFVDAISKVQSGTDKTAAELAIKRLTNELNSLQLKANEKEHYWELQIEPKQLALTTTIKSKESSESINGYLLLVNLFATLLICAVIGALIETILKSFFALSQTDFSEILAVFLVVIGIPIFFVLYFLVAKSWRQ